MKKCINCGKQIPNVATVCPFCGARQNIKNNTSYNKKSNLISNFNTSWNKYTHKHPYITSLIIKYPRIRKFIKHPIISGIVLFIAYDFILAFMSNDNVPSIPLIIGLIIIIYVLYTLRKAFNIFNKNNYNI